MNENKAALKEFEVKNSSFKGKVELLKKNKEARMKRRIFYYNDAEKVIRKEHEIT